MNDFLFNILAWIRGWVGSWGWSMVVFTIMIRLVLTPLDIKSRVSMRKTQKLQPQMQALQKKYANDKEKLNAKTAELYKKEHINPLSSCLPLLLTWPILIAVFGAMRMVANKELLLQEKGTAPDETSISVADPLLQTGTEPAQTQADLPLYPHLLRIRRDSHRAVRRGQGRAHGGVAAAALQPIQQGRL